MMLAEIIVEKIKREGPVSFHDFMEMSLYYPESGYYTSINDKIGKNGDFYTSSSLTSIFGVMIGKQIEEMWEIAGMEPFTIIEYGAGTGLLCHDILEYLKNNIKLYDELNYCIIEKSPVMREKEKAHLHEKVSWHNSIQEIAGVTACVLANEVVDNFSVHQVVMKDELMEVFVDYKNGFIELLQPAKKELKNYFTELSVSLSRDFRTEINLEAIEWLKEIAASLKKGFVITIDYGYPSFDLYRECRSDGTLICYNTHKINNDPYSNIGKQDITAHVNFSALNHWGSKYGLEPCGFTNQAAFLLSLGFENYLRMMNEQLSGDIMAICRKQAFLKYTMLIDMGSKYKVLIQQKGLPKNELSGLKYSCWGGQHNEVGG
jgi:SAM-dependent MidA family methyltransferase